MNRVRPRIVLLAAAFLVLVVQGAQAQFSTDAPAQIGVSSLSLQAPATVTAGTIDACANVHVTWAPSAGADRFRVEARIGSGAWLVVADTPDLDVDVQVAGAAGNTLRVRIVARHMSSGWESPAATESNDVICA